VNSDGAIAEDELTREAVFAVGGDCLAEIAVLRPDRSRRSNGPFEMMNWNLTFGGGVFARGYSGRTSLRACQSCTSG
jgi:hypothetical protein